MVPAEIAGLRTMCNSLHHFAPQDAYAILASAVTAGEPIAIFEVSERSWRGVFSVLLLPPLLWLITPFIRPLTWWRLLFTYLIPLAPLIIMWDALVSALRIYTPDELRAMGEGLPGPTYLWEADRIWHRGFPITYLFGYPIKVAAPKGTRGRR
jgi:hypothetical protein